ncbi:hypothetical protein BC832DRAFT_595883 [Gaertneriomyces semiglobifer]|nr:hypothetical protein BC832DRAFT_595883 [Gaertneriomyces semiglobifer]
MGKTTTPLNDLVSQGTYLTTGKGTKRDTAVPKRIDDYTYSDKELLWEIDEYMKAREKADLEFQSIAYALNRTLMKRNFDIKKLPAEEYLRKHESPHYQNYMNLYPAVGSKLQELCRLLAFQNQLDNYQGNYRPPVQPYQNTMQSLLLEAPQAVPSPFESGPSFNQHGAITAVSSASATRENTPIITPLTVITATTNHEVPTSPVSTTPSHQHRQPSLLLHLQQKDVRRTVMKMSERRMVNVQERRIVVKIAGNLTTG